MRKCKRCDGTGVWETGNNDLPCPCGAGDDVVYSTPKGKQTGAELRAESLSFRGGSYAEQERIVELGRRLIEIQNKYQALKLRVERAIPLLETHGLLEDRHATGSFGDALNDALKILKGETRES